MQLILCTTVPLIFVGICILVKKPGYHMMFKDRMAILPSSYILIFGTVTLPVVISAGASLTMLVAVVRNIRKVSKEIFVVGNHSLTSSFRSSRIPIYIIYERSPLLIFSYPCGTGNLSHQTLVHGDKNRKINERNKSGKRKFSCFFEKHILSADKSIQIFIKDASSPILHLL